MSASDPIQLDMFIDTFKQRLLEQLLQKSERQLRKYHANVTVMERVEYTHAFCSALF